MSDLEVLQSRWKGKVHMWPCMQENNHAYIPVAQAYIQAPHMQIVKPWTNQNSLKQEQSNTNGTVKLSSG